MSAEKPYGLSDGIAVALIGVAGLVALFTWGISVGEVSGARKLCTDALVRGVDRQAVLAVCGEERLKEQLK